MADAGTLSLSSRNSVAALPVTANYRPMQTFDEPEGEAVVVTALHYRSTAPAQPVLATQPSLSGVILPMSNPSDYAARCLALGIGQRCGQLIATLAHATWFDHLRETAEGPRRGLMRTVSDPWAASRQAALAPHVASVSLPAQPSLAELRAACAIGHDL